jgi:hypothetical protein
MNETPRDEKVIANVSHRDDSHIVVRPAPHLHGDNGVGSSDEIDDEVVAVEVASDLLKANHGWMMPVWGELTERHRPSKLVAQSADITTETLDLAPD